MKQKRSRYHRDIFFPEWYKESLDRFSEGLILHPGKHFIYKVSLLKKEKSSYVKHIVDFLSKNTEILKTGVFEFYSDENKKIYKVCVRFGFSDTEDIILVIADTGLLVTMFFNSKVDNHTSLNKNVYTGKES